MNSKIARHPEGAFSARHFTEKVRQLSSISDLRSVAAIAFEYAVFATAAWAAVWSGHWLVYAVAAVFIAARQHALGVLLHDAAHYRLFSNRHINDFVSDIFLAFPLGISTSLYRTQHLDHHRFVNDEQLDPDKACVHDDEDWEWPKTRSACLRLFLRDLTGLSAFRLLKIVCMRWSPWPHLVPHLMKNSGSRLKLREKLLLVVWAICLASLMVWTGTARYLLPLWIIPACTLLAAIFRIRALAEHHGVADTHELNHSRTVLARWWERFLLCPHNVNYHLEHHLFPSVPCTKLHLLHRRLMSDKQYASNAKLTRGYWAMMGELLGKNDPLQKN